MSLPDLFQNNRAWAAGLQRDRPGFLEALSRQQTPEYLWIGCSDSRVPANDIVGLLPGELFVHRNVANLVVHSDLNCLSVLQYAIDILKVRHVILCGHYGCGGVQAAMRAEPLGLIDNWLRHIEDIEMRFSSELRAIRDDNARLNRLCELNVIEQAVNICRTTIVEDAWRRWQPLAVHAWIYGIDDGLLHDLGLHVTGLDDLDRLHARAIHERLTARA